MQFTPMISRDNFEYWLATMDDFLEEFMRRMPSQVRKHLDFTPASLDALEGWILETYESTTAMLPAEQSQIINGVACYVGEVFRRAAGGKWDIRLDDPRFAFHGVPILAGLAPAPECPLTLVSACAHRRTGTYMRTVLENILRMQATRNHPRPSGR